MNKKELFTSKVAKELEKQLTITILPPPENGKEGTFLYALNDRQFGVSMKEGIKKDWKALDPEMIASALAYRINYANRFGGSQKRLGIPKKDLAVQFLKLQTPILARIAHAVKEDNIQVRAISDYWIEGNCTVVRFDVLCRFQRKPAIC